MRHPFGETSFFLTIPIVLKTVGWNNGQAAVAVVSRLAAINHAMVCRAMGRPLLRRCHAIHSHAPMTAAIARCLIQTCAWSSTAMAPPAKANKVAGRVNGSTQQAVQATAASAVAEAVAATTLPPAVFCGAQAQGDESVEGREQVGPMTLM
jgi:hypothetical protein